MPAGPSCRSSPPAKCAMNPKVHFPGPQSRRRAAHGAGFFTEAMLWAGDGTSPSRKKGLGLGGQWDTSGGLNLMVPPRGFGKSYRSTSEPQFAEV